MLSPTLSLVFSIQTLHTEPGLHNESAKLIDKARQRAEALTPALSFNIPMHTLTYESGCFNNQDENEHQDKAKPAVY